jgi:hypothetical protein
LTAAYAVAICVFAMFHEVWRDEVVPVSLVAGSHSLGEVLQKMRDFGHPALFYVALNAGYHLFPHYVVLKILNLLICTSAVWIFLDKSPFHKLAQALFICGFFPLYEYSVINRMYGLFMLMVCMVSALYKDRWRRLIPFSISLALMANTHAHGLVLVLAILLSLASELIFRADRAVLLLGKKKDFAGALAVVLAGLILTVLQILPDSKSVIFLGGGSSPIRIAQAALRAFVNPGRPFYGVFGFNSVWSVNVVLFTLYLYLLRKPKLLILLMSGAIGLSMFFDLLYPSHEIRHQGALYLLVIMVLWMDSSVEVGTRQRPRVFEDMWTGLSAIKNSMLVILLTVQVFMAYPAIREDLARPFSASKLFAQKCLGDPLLKDAIILGEPEGYLESLPYYMDNPTYYFTEGKFTRYRRLTSEGLMTLSLGQLLETARSLKIREGRPVVILLDREVGAPGKNVIYFMHKKKSFTFSKEELKELHEQTILVADFPDAISDEKFRVYAVK